MRKIVPLLLVLTAAVPAAAQDIQLPPGTELETRTDGDLNGDGVDDIAFLAGNEDGRTLTVLLSVKGEVDVDFTAETLELEPTMFGPGTLTIAGNVLTFEDLTGGTTAIASNRRFRYDGLRKRMRLIGLDATVYSRMFAPGAGIVEDPATGSAAGPLGSYLVRHGLVHRNEMADMVNLQGVAMGRASRLHMRIAEQDGAITRVQVGGKAIRVGEGVIDL